MWGYTSVLNITYMDVNVTKNTNTQCQWYSIGLVHVDMSYAKS